MPVCLPRIIRILHFLARRSESRCLSLQGRCRSTKSASTVRPQNALVRSVQMVLGLAMILGALM